MSYFATVHVREATGNRNGVPEGLTALLAHATIMWVISKRVTGFKKDIVTRSHEQRRSNALIGLKIATYTHVAAVCIPYQRERSLQIAYPSLYRPYWFDDLYIK